MKVSKIIILFLITRVYSAFSSYCDNFDSAYMHGCKRRNNANNIDDSFVYRKPIFAGKCCWHTDNGTQGYGKCKYLEEPDIFKWRASGYSCFTGVEKCLAVEDVPYKDYSFAILFQLNNLIVAAILEMHKEAFASLLIFFLIKFMEKL